MQPVGGGAFLKTYIMRILCLAILNALCDLFLPAGNVRRFAAPCIGLSITAAILLPAFSLLQTDAPTLLPAVEVATDANVYGDALLSAYREKIEAAILEKTNVRAEVELSDDYSIRRIVLWGDPGILGMHYIEKDLGVLRRNVEIR